MAHRTDWFAADIGGGMWTIANPDFPVGRAMNVYSTTLREAAAHRADRFNAVGDTAARAESCPFFGDPV